MAEPGGFVVPPGPPLPESLAISTYSSELQLPELMDLFEADLSEPYSAFTYRFFLSQWPELCLMARTKDGDRLVAGIICKLERHKRGSLRGYIGMLAVRKEYRGMKLGARRRAAPNEGPTRAC